MAGGFPFQPLILNLEQWDPLSPAIPQLYLLLLLLIIIPVLFLLAPQPPVPPPNRQCGMRTLNLAYFHSAFLYVLFYLLFAPRLLLFPLVANFPFTIFFLLYSPT